jgi:RNA polymerase sigma-B factor
MQRWHGAGDVAYPPEPVPEGDMVTNIAHPVGNSFDVDRYARRYQRTKDIAARNRIVDEYCWFADRFARQFARRGEPLNDLTQVARLALVKAAERYDPDRSSKFESYARPTIIGELRRHFRDQTWSLKVPRSCKDLRPLVLGAREQLEQEYGRPATVSEVADFTELDRGDVAATLDANAAYRTRPIDFPGDGEFAGGAARRAIAQDQISDDRLEVVDLLQHLDERARKILYWHYFEDRTQREIGAELGIGQVQVSRLLKSAIRQLQLIAQHSKITGDN